MRMHTHTPFSARDVLTLIIGHGIPQKTLATAFGIGKATISNWVNGRRLVPREYWPDLWALAGLTQAYGAAALDIWHPTVRAIRHTDSWSQVAPSVPLPDDLATMAHDSALTEQAYAIAVLRGLAPYMHRHPHTNPLTPAEAETLRGLATALLIATWELLTVEVKST
jgi:transcriptional regulator with XRE-family HTH domain